MPKLHTEKIELVICEHTKEFIEILRSELNLEDNEQSVNIILSVITHDPDLGLLVTERVAKRVIEYQEEETQFIQTLNNLFSGFSGEN